MAKSNPRLKPGHTCKDCGVTLQHNKETKTSAIIRQTEDGSELDAVRVEIKITCRGCEKETVIISKVIYL